MDKTKSVGFVKTEILSLPLPEEGFLLEKGGTLKKVDVAFERYGTLSPGGDNGILLCHALTGDAHAAGYHEEDDPKPGWWDSVIGPGKTIDTNTFHVICANFLGGCKGTTGPQSINPETGKPYGISFPEITIGDMVRAQRALLDALGIKKLYAVIGGSAGGFQALEWSVTYPGFMEKVICIAAAESLSAQALAFDIVARKVIKADPSWNQGRYLEQEAPGTGLSIARMIGHITYLSKESMSRKFGRKRKNGSKVEQFHTDFEVESYLNYQGRKFVERFDANTYLYITQAMNSFSLGERGSSLKEVLAPCKASFFLISISSDWLFPASQSRELAEHLLLAGKEVSYCNFDSPLGHDAFLIKDEQLFNAIAAFLKKEKISTCHKTGESRDYKMISSMIGPGKKVLDLGCGTGDFLNCMKKEKNTPGLGIDIDFSNIIECHLRGVQVFQSDLDQGLKVIPDKAYDYAVLNDTLFEVHKPREVLQEMLRVAHRGIISFPNFANWYCRFTLGIRGLLPESPDLPYKWYETPNKHYLTYKDFKKYCLENNIHITMLKTISLSRISRFLRFLGFKSLGTDRIVAEITASK